MHGMTADVKDNIVIYLNVSEYCKCRIDLDKTGVQIAQAGGSVEMSYEDFDALVDIIRIQSSRFNGEGNICIDPSVDGEIEEKD